MNKKYIWLVTIVLGISLCGLILVQITYFKNAAKIKEDQFTLTVNKALDKVVQRLEYEEMAKLIREGNIANIPSNKKGLFGKTQPNQKINFKSSYLSIDIPINPHQQEKPRLRFSTNDTTIYSSEGDLNARTFSNLSEAAVRLQSQFLNYTIPGNLWVSHLAASLSNATRPLEQRISSVRIGPLIKEKLHDNGIKLPFEYAVKSSNKVVCRSNNYYKFPRANKYIKQLFPNDMFSNSSNLYVYFPNKSQYFIRSYLMFLPSVVLTLVLILCCGFTIYIIFRQKKLSKIKNDFINNMTHEFKTPISTISLASQMLKDNTVSSTPKTIKHIAKIINDENHRLSFQVEKVLQMAIFNEGRMKLKLKAINVHKIIQNLLPNFIIRVEDKNGIIYQNLDANYDLVMADEMHLTNVFSNLLDNAIKYCYEAPEISVNTRIKDKNIVVGIIDNGIGISKDDQKMIFERFYRVPTGNVHNVKGFGLGLSYVKKIVVAHNGHAFVESAPGKGSKFEIHLPLKNEM